MNIQNSFLLIFFPVLIFAQEIKTDNDSVSDNSKDLYIENHSEQLNIKFDITNDQIRYFMPFDGDKATIQTNLNASLGLVFSYKFLSVRLGVRPGLTDKQKENKGETDFFRLRVKLLFDKWTHRFEYNYTRGFYIENTEDLGLNESNSSFHIQLPHLTTNIFTGSTHYNFNDNYSLKAIESNTEIQLKSAGTFIAGVNYTFYDVAGTNKVKDENGNILDKTIYNEYNGFNFILNGGYHYTFILHSYWYVNVRANPGIGFDFYKTTFYSENPSEEKNNQDIFFAINSGLSAGYNGQKFYFGAEYNYTVNSEKYDNEDINLQPIKNSFHIFIGYRFKAPKQLKKPVDKIEEMVPILKDGEGN